MAELGAAEYKMTKGEEKGLVPKRKIYETPVGPREMLGPYDISFERQEQIEALAAGRGKLIASKDSLALRQAMHSMMNLIFVKPFTEPEFKKLIMLRVMEWQADFFAEFATSSKAATTRQATLANREERRAQSAPRSRPTTKRATR